MGRTRVTIDGNEAAAYIAYKTNEVIAIYPITPSTPMGDKPSGGELALQGAWFTRDKEVFGALLYGDLLSPDLADTFFSGLKFR